jgi:hypothetical protein
MLGIWTIQLETRYPITRMTNEDVIKLFPKSADAIKVAELMKIVKSAETRNRKVKELADNAEKLAGVTLNLLDRFV